MSNCNAEVVGPDLAYGRIGVSRKVARVFTRNSQWRLATMRARARVPDRRGFHCYARLARSCAQPLAHANGEESIAVLT